jgi:hypothetical protein
MLRRAAAVTLDVAESELEVGIQPLIDPTTPFAPTDGASDISFPIHWRTVLATARISQMWADSRSSCFLFWASTLPASVSSTIRLSAYSINMIAALRAGVYAEFGNMAYHPLLDWRLGLDMARLAVDPAAQIDLVYPYWSDLVNRVATPYFSGLGMTPAIFSGLAGRSTSPRAPRSF